MTEPEYIERINSVFIDDWTTPASPLSLATVDEAVREFPNSASLWFLHGKVTMASEDESEEIPRIAARSFHRALELDPNCARTHRELAIYYDGIAEDLDKARFHNRRAMELSGEIIE